MSDSQLNINSEVFDVVYEELPAWQENALGTLAESYDSDNDRLILKWDKLLANPTAMTTLSQGLAAAIAEGCTVPGDMFGGPLGTAVPDALIAVRPRDFTLGVMTVYDLFCCDPQLPLEIRNKLQIPRLELSEGLKTPYYKGLRQRSHIMLIASELSAITPNNKSGLAEVLQGLEREEHTVCGLLCVVGDEKSAADYLNSFGLCLHSLISQQQLLEWWSADVDPLFSGEVAHAE